MKTFEELTYLGQVRRMRRVATGALEAFGLAGARLDFVHQAGNTLYRGTAPRLIQGDEELFEAGQFLLRIHEPGYQTAEAIELELAWLSAMRREAGLPVPEPIAAPDGRLLVAVSVPGVPGARNCSVLRWLKGRLISKNIGPQHYRAQGRLMARLHNHAASWQPPLTWTKRHWNWKALFQELEGTDLTVEEVWPLIPARYSGAFERVMERTGRVMEAWGTGTEVYGLIHGDLGLDANLLFWQGDARAIDFDDSGFGYWIYDLAIALEHCREEEAYGQYREALLEGYAEFRCLPYEQLGELDLFLAAFDVYLCLWAAAMTQVYPHHREEALQRLERAAGFVVGYVEGGN